MHAKTGSGGFASHTLIVEILGTHPEGETILATYSDQLFERWMDFESQRWTPPEPRPPVEGQRYHGAG